jgi:3-methyladenine DNA glycosylase AlkD
MKTVEEILTDLEGMADPRAVVIWQRMGLETTHYLGVGLTKINNYSKSVGKSQEVAEALWKTGIHDARLLATFIAEPKKISAELAEEWMNTAAFWDLSDKICTNVIAKTSFGPEKMRAWTAAENPEFKRRSGFMLLARIAPTGKIDEEELSAYLQMIEREVTGERNWVKEAMNWALICIGGVDAALHTEALTIARRLGPIDVDYGDSSCKSPDAVTHLTSERVLKKLE